MVLMGIQTYLPGAGFVDSRVEELDRKLKRGDGLIWSGDPGLELRIGVRLAPKRMQHPVTGRWINRGDLVMKRYEVWATTEDGRVEPIGYWNMDEFDRILYDIVQMKAGYEGKIENVETRIDKRNAEVEKQRTEAFRDAYGAMMDHYLALFVERNNGKGVFYGMPGRNPDRQM